MASPHAFIDGTNIQQLDNSVKFSKPKPNNGGGKVINILNTHTNQILNIVTPVITTWGANEGKDQNGNLTGKWSVSLQFPNDDYPNPEATKFLAFLKRFEEIVKETALHNSMDWLGIAKTKVSSPVIDVMFNAMLKYPKLIKGKPELDFNKAPSLTGKLPYWKTGWQVEVFDENSQPLFVKADNGKDDASPLKYLSGKILNAKYILQPTVWIANSKASITWNVVQALVKKPQSMRIPEGVCMLGSLSDVDTTALETNVQMDILLDEDIVTESNTISAMIEDSDTDENENEDILISSQTNLVVEPQVVKNPTTILEETKKPKKNSKK
jgi:hypothetical protein